MTLHSVRFFCLWALALVLPFTASAKQPSLAPSLPDGAIGFVELSNLGEIVKSVKDSQAVKWALTTDEWKKFESSPEYLKANAAKSWAELMLGGNLWDASADLLSGRIAVALYPGEGTGSQPTGVAILHLDESKALERGRDLLKPLLGTAGKTVDTSAVWPGSNTWSVKDQAFVSINGGWVVAAQHRALLDRTLALLGNAKDKPAALATQENFASMERGLGEEHHARVWVNTATIKKSLGDRFGLPKKAEDGMASFIFGGLIELADRSPFAAATLDVRKNEVEGILTIAGDPAKLPEPAPLWYVQYPENGVIPLPKTPGTLFGFTMHRKLGQWYRQRDQLLADRLLPAFDTFETGIANLLPQKDFGQDILPLIGDNFTIVSAMQDYKHLDGAPGIKLPAFAAIFDLPKPAEGTDTFALFFQTLGAILNLNAGQESRQPSVMDTEMYNDTKLSYSRFLSKPKGDRLALAYNFQPAAASVGRKYILSSSVQLCRDLIDHFKKPESSQWQNRNSEMVVDFAGLAKLAELNEGFLRSQDIQKGTAPDAAEKRVGLLIKLLQQFDTLRYHSNADGGMFKMNLKLGWK